MSICKTIYSPKKLWIYQLSATVFHSEGLVKIIYLVQHTTIEYSVPGFVFFQMPPVDLSLDVLKIS